MAIMEVSTNKLALHFGKDHSTSLESINGMINTILSNEQFKDVKDIGINVSVASSSGFALMVAAMLRSVTGNGGVPHILNAVPRERIESLDVLAIDSWSKYERLGESKDWYKLIIICEPKTGKNGNHLEYSNVITFDKLISDYKQDKVFRYSPPDDNLDDKKALLKISFQNMTTEFSQLNLVSSLATFIKGFPMNHEITGKDCLTILLRDTSKNSNISLQMWTKLLSVLLHGGSISFIDQTLTMRNIPTTTTLLLTELDSLKKLADSVKNQDPPISILQRLKLSYSKTLISEGIFTQVGKHSLPELDQLRCIFVADSLEGTEQITTFKSSIPKLQKEKYFNSLDTRQLNSLRAIFGSRIVIELYCPYLIFGPIFQTNFYDYRVFSDSVNKNFICFGTLSTSLEGKLIATLNDLDITKRQGMLCVRGFTIGKPLESSRQDAARKLSAQLGGGEGWMPLNGVFGLWGKDGCFYLYTDHHSEKYKKFIEANGLWPY